MTQTTVRALTDDRVDAGASSSLRAIAAAAARVHAWAAGNEARRRTAHALRDVARTGWDVDHDVRLPGGQRIDHLVAGPSGLFLLASRAWQGVVTVDHKGATITPVHDPAAAWTARGAHRSLPATASTVVRALSTTTGGHLPPPRPVVVVWAVFPEQVTVCAGVSYVAGEHLVDWLVAQPSAHRARDE
ncbi:hypothetical protein DQ241_17805 [Blastococcus sp. TF02A-30]|nr:hypothetical protein DQ241_17805 [Blastococcus sp. TF02A-30]